MSISERLELLISADPSQGIAAMRQFATGVDSSLTTAESRLKKFSVDATKVGASGMGIGALLTQIGSAEQQAEQQLDAAITAAGQSVDDYAGRISKAESTEEGFAHTHDDTDQALQTLTQAYGDTGKALDRLQLVTDVAAARHISLASAADLVARAHGGAAKVFKVFGIQVGENADGTKDYEGALDQLSQKVSGQASASVDNYVGKLKVLGTEVRDHVAEFGEKFGPAILGGSTVLTTLAGATTAAVAVQTKLAASHAASALAADAQAASESAFTAATSTSTVSAASLSAINSELSTSFLTLNTAADPAVASLYAVSAAEDSAATSAAAFAAVATLGVAALAGAAYGLNQFADNVVFGNDSIDTFTKDLSTAKDALKDTFGDASTFNPQKLVDGMTQLVRTNHDYAKALVDAHTTTSEFTVALTAGGDAFGKYLDKVAHGKDVTEDDRIALGALGEAANRLAEDSLNAATANGELDQSTLDAAEAGHHFADGSVDFVGALADLANHGKISKEKLDEVADAANRQLDASHVKALADQLQNVQKHADEAFAAILKLEPADIRVQQGKISIEGDKAAVDAAQAKLKWDEAAGASAEQLAADQRDLESAQLTLQQATLDEAAAMEELNKDLVLAAGGHVTQQQETSGTIGALSELNSTLTGPTHDAIALSIWDMTVFANKARDAKLAAEGITGALPGALSGNDGGGPAPSPGGGKNPTPNASGGDLTPGWHTFGEAGTELGYVGPGMGGHVWNATDTEKMKGGGGDTHNYYLMGRDAYEAADEIARMHNRRRILEAVG